MVDWFDYNSSVRKRYLRAFFTNLSKEERYKDRGASHPSFIDIFRHVLHAYCLWIVEICPMKQRGYKRLLGNLGDNRVSDLQSLRKQNSALRLLAEEERQIDSYVSKFVHKLRPSDLDREFPVAGEKRGWRVRRMSIRTMLVHW
jgi:uncharacterized damage-inducible protein DinB